jgi:haloalkane dehalogenase
MGSDPPASERFEEYWADRAGHRIRVRDYPGADPPVVLMHGFPDDLHLYDRVVPLLAGTRRIVTFDFLGWGGSDKPAGYPYTADNMTGDIDAVLQMLDADQVVLVAHDASGPPAVDWSIAHPDRVISLVLLNTYYGFMPKLRTPEAITLYSMPVLRHIAQPIMGRLVSLNRRLYLWQVARFIRDDDVRAELLPRLYAAFKSTVPAMFRLAADLPRALLNQTRNTPALRAFRRPVWIVFGADDRYLNVHVARRFAETFPSVHLELIENARHYVQVDEPGKVATAILNASEEPPITPKAI